MEELRTLCFKTRKQAKKQRYEIVKHFSGRIIDASIQRGIDERNEIGFFVKYTLTK